MINMKGLVQLVDKVGGITVNNPFDFDISDRENEPEYTPRSHQDVRRLMETKLVHSRMRYQDPEGDYGTSKTANVKWSKIKRKF